MTAIRAALLPDITTKAGFDEIDPISQWFRGGATAGADASGIVDDDRYGLNLRNSGVGGLSFTTLSGNGTYGVRVDNTAAASIGNWAVAGTLQVTGVQDFTGASTFRSSVDVTGAATFRSTLTTVGASDFTGASTFRSNASVAGTLQVTGAQDFTGASTFRSSVDVTGATTFRSTTDHTGVATFRNNVAIVGTLQVTGSQDFTGSALFRSTLTALQYGSTVAIGTPPYSCTSTTVNPNLNADMVDGLHASSFARIHTGSYTGNGGTQALSGFGFAPSTVGIMDTGTGTVYGVVQNGISIFMTSGGATGNSTATMGADGITLLAAAGLNVNTHTYAYVAIG
jgi:hypothetical protein